MQTNMSDKIILLITPNFPNTVRQTKFVHIESNFSVLHVNVAGDLCLFFPLLNSNCVTYNRLPTVMFSGCMLC